MDKGIFPLLLCVDVWFYYVWNNNNDSLQKDYKTSCINTFKNSKVKPDIITPESHAGNLPSPVCISDSVFREFGIWGDKAEASNLLTLNSFY